MMLDRRKLTLIILLVFFSILPTWSMESFQKTSTMFELYDFIFEYFREKSITRLTLFDCSDNDATKRFVSRFSTSDLLVSNCKLTDAFSNCFDHLLKVDRSVLVGYVVDVTCPSSSITILFSLASIKRQFTYLQYWLLVDNTELNTSDIFMDKQPNKRGLDVLARCYSNSLNSNVFWIQSGSNSTEISSENPPEKSKGLIYEIFDVYRISSETEPIFNMIGFFSTTDFKTILDRMLGQSSVSDRKNLQGLLLKGAHVVQFPDNWTYIGDLHRIGIETFLQTSFPSMELLREDINFTNTLVKYDTFGWDLNNSGIFIGGLMAGFQQQSINISMQSTIMRRDRLVVCDYTAEIIQIKARVVFRRPPLSSITNIYLLPFNQDVWYCCFGAVLVTFLLIIIQFTILKRRDKSMRNIRAYDVMMIIVSVICQQGSEISPKFTSARITTLLVYITSLFLFTSYSASIVNLLQTSSTSIKNLDNLLNSPITLGVQNIPYNLVSLKESQGVTRQLYERKVQSKCNFFNVYDGVERIRRGLFAFQVDTAAAYDIISQTYQEHEKCDLTELELYKLPIAGVPIAKYSPYKDLVTTRLRWQREIGLLNRISQIWIPHKPSCGAEQSLYKSVGIVEFWPPIKLFLSGVIVSVTILMVEIILKSISTHLTHQKHHVKNVKFSKSLNVQTEIFILRR